MSGYVEAFLEQLIKHINKPDGVVSEKKIRITDHTYRGYFALNNSEKQAIHRALEELECIKLQYQRKVAIGAFQPIEIVHITDGCRLLSSQGRSPLADEIQNAFRQIDAAKFDVPWWGETKRDIAEAWTNNKSYKKIKRTQATLLFDAMKVIEWIVQSTDASPTPDMRTLSSTLLNDSKKLEEKSLTNLIYRLMIDHLDEDVTRAVEDDNGLQLLAYYGISKYPMPMRLKANAQLACRGVVDLEALRYGIGVSPDEIKGIEWKQPPPYVLFIENRASFERYVREIDDMGLVIYTAGFPPRSWVHAIAIIIAEIREVVPVYHWGDRDVGGYRILAFLAKRLDINIRPYLMGVDTPASIQEQDDDNEVRLVADLMQAIESARHYPAIGALYAELKALPYSNLPWVEQEQIAPMSPVDL